VTEEIERTAVEEELAPERPGERVDGLQEGGV
jgi:hypothetical protein